LGILAAAEYRLTVVKFLDELWHARGEGGGGLCFMGWNHSTGSLDIILSLWQNCVGFCSVYICQTKKMGNCFRKSLICGWCVHLDVAGENSPILLMAL
jgi:hypothetical protein